MTRTNHSLQEHLTRAGTLLVMLVLTASALPSTGASEHGENAPSTYRYTAGGAADLGECFRAGETTFCAMGGGALCDTGAVATTSNVGGACTGLRVDAGETFEVSVADDVGGATAFGACVDADGDGVCRPDVGGATDLWHTQRCGRGSATLTAPASGTLYVFVLDELDASGARACVPTTGTVTVKRFQPPQCSDGRDNDGDGWADFPHDPGCSSPADHSEYPAECSDGKDNDGDGWTDWPLDRDCSGPDDTSERPVIVN